MSRKHILGVSTDAPETPAAESRTAKSRSMPLLGVVRKERDPSTKLTANIGNALREQNDRLGRAEEIERRLAEGHAVVELDALSIEPSFVQDRMQGDIDGLLVSIREQGQQVPILVRPHPEQPGRYQVAFGHRRLRAVLHLGLPVKAIVRDLTDEQLVVAQGQENNEREDLTFIEKARFAHRLNKQFSREIVIAAMSIDKSNLSKMLLLVDALPSELIDAIGAAPGVGRPSWQQLAELVEKAASPSDAIKFAASAEVQTLPSADRFKALIGHLKPRRIARGLPDVMSTPDGDRLAQVTQSKSKLEITIDRKATPDFAAFVLEHLPALYQAHRAKHQQKQGD
ncbi:MULTISPECIES: plasmid partitioning protein RepB [Hyphomicrobiales]|jgi:ParB family transcriptional regulator, chromosome partitioning protein|uniref:plasmid partitioning protein RepB n=1 Tax=Hyphomicrobiales TaxID=356 RepID=UPI000513CAC8|nr:MULTISPECIES: plasmid partitioning protein RepB [Agrobacterium]ANV25412.1 plasmid partitioning protein RepB [Rhizobium sp. S41]KGE80023.1 replication protein B [Rhizobium sp. H41]MCD4663418.1 plasmid partitioning protein RepB [Agrobacterium sp.]MDH0873631.1 plasmid partitioning protein RepB [Agrobacterium pusense]OJH52292.1 plasmid partitioning protein RepB [Agrobacterium pusense]